MVHVHLALGSMRIWQLNYSQWVINLLNDPDLWIKDMGNHYEYIATYIDDLLIASRNPAPIIKELEQTYMLKGVGDPVYYLGANIVQTKELDEWKMEPID